MTYIKKYILAFDTSISLILTLSLIYFAPESVSGKLIKDLLGIGISTLSVIFSIFFAALAFIISASDDEFVSFLEEEGLFTQLINHFKWTVGSLFIALVYSLIFYAVISFQLEQDANYNIIIYPLALFTFLLFYSLIATILSTNDAIRYSKTRLKFLQIKNKISKKTKNN